jgi:predicted nucleic acid-binding Zn finger protein
MGNARKDIVYNGFAGGLCSVQSGEIALPNQLQQAINAVILENGVVRKRPGVKQIEKNYFAAWIIDLFNGYKSMSSKTIAVVNSTIHTYTTGGLGQFAYMDRYLHTNGSDPMVAITGITAASCLGAPLSRVMLKHNDRCFMAVGRVLYETAVGTYPDSAVDNFADGATWTIGDTGQNIIGLGSIGRNLLIFKQKSIYIQVGYTKSERQTYLLSSEYGCLSPDTIKNVNLKGIGPAVMFLSDEAKLCAATMEGVIEVGDAVQDILDTIYLGTAVNEKAISTYLHRARAGVDPSGYYILGFATVATDAYNSFNQALCVSLNEPYDSQFGRRWPITLWKYTGTTDTSEIYYNALGVSDVATVYGYKLHLPAKEPGGHYTWVEVDWTRYNDQWGTGIPYTNKWVDMILQTRNEDAGTRQINKQWTDCLIKVVQEQPAVGLAFYPLKLTQEVDYNLTINSPPTVYQENVVGPNKPAKYLIELQHGLVGDGIQTNIILENYNSAGDGDLRIHGMTIQFLRSNAV